MKKLAKVPSRPWWPISRAAIRKLARQIAQRFQPDKIILFGSYAYGKPHPDSDVDLLVVMPAKNMINQAVRILKALDYDFPLDLIVRTPEFLRWRLKEGDWFLREIMEKGKVLYEKTDSSGRRIRCKPRRSISPVASHWSPAALRVWAGRSRWSSLSMA